MAALLLAGALLIGCKTSREAPVVEAIGQPLTTCSSFTVTTNSYVGSEWWGTITFRNNGPNTLTSYKVEFDVPSGKHCTAEPESVPPGATLTPLTGSNPPHTTSNHCVFTWTNTAPLASGASKTFNYSADTQSFSSASNVRVTDTACGTSCAMAITTNNYNGSQWWGTITFKNSGQSPASTYQVEFDVPSGKHCTAEPESVPPGATLTPLTGSNPPHTTSNHCIFTWTKTAPLAPGASKTFNYSTDTQSFSAASNVVARDLLCAGSGPSKGTGATFPPGAGPPKANPPERTADDVHQQHGDASMPPSPAIPGAAASGPMPELPPVVGPDFYARVHFELQGSSITAVFAKKFPSELRTSETVDGGILVVGKMNGNPTFVVTLLDPRTSARSLDHGVLEEHTFIQHTDGDFLVDLPAPFVTDATALQNSLFQFYALPDTLDRSTPVVVSNLSTLVAGATLLGEVPGSAFSNLLFPVIP